MAPSCESSCLKLCPSPRAVVLWPYTPASPAPPFPRPWLPSSRPSSLPLNTTYAATHLRLHTSYRYIDENFPSAISHRESPLYIDTVCTLPSHLQRRANRPSRLLASSQSRSCMAYKQLYDVRWYIPHTWDESGSGVWSCGVQYSTVSTGFVYIPTSRDWRTRWL